MLFSMVEDGIPKYVFDGQVKGGGILLPQENTPATPTLAFGDGDSGFYESSNNSLGVAINGTNIFEFVGSYMRGTLGDRCPLIINEVGSNINPVFTFKGNIDTGLGSAAADQLSLISGGVEGIRITEVAGAITNNLNGQTILPLSNTPATPTLAFGDGDSGFYESADDSLAIALSGLRYYKFNAARFINDSAVADGFSLELAGPTSTVPNIIPNRTDLNSGIGHATADALSLIAGGVEGIRVTETAGAITISGGGINVENGLSQRVAVPATAGAAGTTGQFAFDANHFYACVGASTWVRTTLATW